MLAKSSDPMLLIRDALTEHIRDVAAELRFWVEQLDGLDAQSAAQSQGSEQSGRENVTLFRKR